MTYTFVDEEPANVARAIIFMYTSIYPNNDTISRTEEPVAVKKLLNTGRKTATDTTQQPQSPGTETSTAEPPPRALCMYKIARKLEMEELQTFSLGMLGQNIAWEPQVFWTMLKSVDSFSNGSDPLARFASEMAKKHLLKLCGDIRFQDLIKSEPAFAYTHWSVDLRRTPVSTSRHRHQRLLHPSQRSCSRTHVCPRQPLL